MTIPAGFVACQPRTRTRVTKLHLMREDQTGTICGRYTIDQILPEETELPANTPVCKVCSPATEHSHADAWHRDMCRPPGAAPRLGART